MAIVNLGSRSLDIGNAPVAFDGFDFRDARAYLFNVVLSIPKPDNVFSELLIKVVYNNQRNTGYYTHHLLRYPIVVRPFTFLVPFSALYDGDGTANIEMERVPLITGGSDAAGPIGITLTYDDAAAVRTWL